MNRYDISASSHDVGTYDDFFDSTFQRRLFDNQTSTNVSQKFCLLYVVIVVSAFHLASITGRSFLMSQGDSIRDIEFGNMLLLFQHVLTTLCALFLVHQLFGHQFRDQIPWHLFMAITVSLSTTIFDFTQAYGKDLPPRGIVEKESFDLIDERASELETNGAAETKQSSDYAGDQTGPFLPSIPLNEYDDTIEQHNRIASVPIGSFLS